MSKYEIFSDYTTLNKKDASDFMANISKLADEAFKNSDNKTRLLGNLVILEQYFNTLKDGLNKNDEKPSSITYKSIDMLWDYLYGKIKPSDFEDFANNLYACVLEYMVGEDLTDEQSEFYENNFPNDNISSIEWQIIGWISYLLLELTAIHGGKINFDEFKSCDFIDFVSLDEILNILSDACIDFAKVECKSNMAKDVIKAFEDVCVTPLFQSIIIKIQKSLKEALDAKLEDYQNLRNKQCSILPQEFAADFLEF